MSRYDAFESKNKKYRLNTIESINKHYTLKTTPDSK